MVFKPEFLKNKVSGPSDYVQLDLRFLFHLGHTTSAAVVAQSSGLRRISSFAEPSVSHWPANPTVVELIPAWFGVEKQVA